MKETNPPLLIAVSWGVCSGIGNVFCSLSVFKGVNVSGRRGSFFTEKAICSLIFFLCDGDQFEKFMLCDITLTLSTNDITINQLKVRV
jgi:hypothetical protein